VWLACSLHRPFLGLIQARFFQVGPKPSYLHQLIVALGSTLDELVKKKEEGAAKQTNNPGMNTSNPDIQTVTYEDYEDPFSWQYQSSKERHINTLSPFSWVASRGSYILECMGKGSLRLEPLVDNGEHDTAFDESTANSV
jgi:hypothetical protein